MTFAQVIFPWPVAIFVDSDECSRIFAVTLKTKLEALLTQRKLNIDQVIANYQFENDSSILEDISSSLRMLSARLITTVILICNSDLIELIFKQGFSMGLPTADRIWIMFESGLALDDRISPKHLLSIKSEGSLDSIRYTLNGNAINILNAKVLSSQNQISQPIVK